MVEHLTDPRITKWDPAPWYWFILLQLLCWWWAFLDLFEPVWDTLAQLRDDP